MIEVNDIKYEMVKDYRDAFDLNDFISHYTDFYEDYDYIVGDIAYNKLRLKGFYDNKNKKAKDINNYKNVDRYITNDCAFDCRYFILKKIKEK